MAAILALAKERQKQRQSEIDDTAEGSGDSSNRVQVAGKANSEGNSA